MIDKTVRLQLDKISDIIQGDFGVIDDNGIIIYCSSHSNEGIVSKLPLKQNEDGEFINIEGTYFYKCLINSGKNNFIYYKDNDEKKAKQILLLISIILEQHEENTKSKNIEVFRTLMLEGSGAVNAVELSLRTKKKIWGYMVIFIKCKNNDDKVCYEILEGLYPTGSNNTVVMLGERKLAVVCQLDSEEKVNIISEEASLLADTLRAEAMIDVYVALGPFVKTLAEINYSFKQAELSCEIGRIFEFKNSVFKYDKLGVARLIYGMEREKCLLFIKEVFGEELLKEKSGKELLKTVKQFLDNNQNVSETSRALYIHRNTLIYRLDKFNKLTGLDCTLFEDGMLFRLALMILRYLEVIEK